MIPTYPSMEKHTATTVTAYRDSNLVRHDRERTKGVKKKKKKKKGKKKNKKERPNKRDKERKAKSMNECNI